MVLYKLFFKIYTTTSEGSIFEGIIAISPPSNSSEAIHFAQDLNFIQEDSGSFKLTTLATYMEYKLHLDRGNVEDFEDLQTQDISC